MPSLRTRLRYQDIILAQTDGLTAEAAATLAELEAGTLDLDAVTIGGQRFINNAGNLEVEP